MLRRWRKITSRRRARLKFKQQPMTPSSSPVREILDQEDCDDSTTIPAHDHLQQPEKDDGLRRRDRPVDQLPVHGQVNRAVAELEGLSLEIDTFTRGKNEVVEAVSDDEEKGRDASPEQPASPLEDPEEGSQTSSEESWASFPSSGSCSTDSGASADEQEEEPPGAVATDAPLPSPETTFKFHEEFSSSDDSQGDDDNDDGSEPPMSPLPPPGEDGAEFAMEEDEEEDLAPSPTGPWSSSAVPRWAFLRSSNSLPVLGLGPEDFYHGGSALRHEVSADEDEDEDEEGSDEDAESRGPQEIAAVGVVHL